VGERLKNRPDPATAARAEALDHQRLSDVGLGDDEVVNLRRYLTYGGFMLADANDGSNGDGFDAAFRFSFFGFE
jgi:hypothetical protein